MFWDVIKKPVGEKFIYQVFHKIRDTEPLHAGNMKIYGTYETEEEAYEVAYVLNKEAEVEGC